MQNRTEINTYAISRQLANTKQAISIYKRAIFYNKMERITFNDKILGGKAIIKGTRISVDFILELLSSGVSIDEILNEYKHLTKEDILAALVYASKVLKHEEILTER